MLKKHERFIEAYLTTAAGNASEAARTAGYAAKNAGITGWKLLRHPMIAPLLAKRRAELERKADLSADRILQETATVAYTQGVEVKGSDKVKALQLLGKYRNLFVDNSKDSGSARIQVNIGFLTPQPPQLATFDVKTIRDDKSGE